LITYLSFRRLWLPCLLFGIALWFVECSSFGAIYPVSAAEAHQLLQNTDVPRIIFGDANVEIHERDEGTSQIVWEIDEGGDEQLHFTATLQPIGANHTRVTVAVAGPDHGPHIANTKRLESSPTISNLYRRAMEEQIASVIEHRPFELTRVYPALTVAEIANLPQLSAQMDAAAADYNRRERDNMENAYAKAAAGH